jgi:hypothetical protein
MIFAKLVEKSTLMTGLLPSEITKSFSIIKPFPMFLVLSRYEGMLEY